MQLLAPSQNITCPEFVNFTENICPHATHKFDRVLKDKIEWAIAVASKAERD